MKATGIPPEIQAKLKARKGPLNSCDLSRMVWDTIADSDWEWYATETANEATLQIAEEQGIDHTTQAGEEAAQALYDGPENLCHWRALELLYRPAEDNPWISTEEDREAFKGLQALVIEAIG